MDDTNIIPESVSLDKCPIQVGPNRSQDRGPRPCLRAVWLESKCRMHYRSMLKREDKKRKEECSRNYQEVIKPLRTVAERTQSALLGAAHKRAAHNFVEDGHVLSLFEQYVEAHRAYWAAVDERRVTYYDG